MPDTPDLLARADDLDEAPVRLPGMEGEVFAKLINIDAARGLVASLIRFAPGASIAAHVHRTGAEAHYVVEGELIDAGRPCGPGIYLTHAAGVPHGPHESPKGCTVLTIQDRPLDEGDHELV